MAAAFMGLSGAIASTKAPAGPPAGRARHGLRRLFLKLEDVRRHAAAPADEVHEAMPIATATIDR